MMWLWIVGGVLFVGLLLAMALSGPGEGVIRHEARMDRLDPDRAMRRMNRRY